LDDFRGKKSGMPLFTRLRDRDVIGAADVP